MVVIHNEFQCLYQVTGVNASRAVAPKTHIKRATRCCSVISDVHQFANRITTQNFDHTGLPRVYNFYHLCPEWSKWPLKKNYRGTALTSERLLVVPLSTSSQTSQSAALITITLPNTGTVTGSGWEEDRSVWCSSTTNSLFRGHHQSKQV